MDPELKARWIAALRSGDYTRGVGGLGHADGAAQKRYCCLGVLCDVEKECLAAAGVEVWWESNTLHVGGFAGISYPSPLACQVLGLSNAFWHLTIVTQDGTNPSLDHLNDNGFTFDQIADIIDWAF